MSDEAWPIEPLAQRNGAPARPADGKVPDRDSPAADVALRYTLIDGLRGIAALAVLCWHYQHFFMDAGRNLPVIAELDLPLRWLLTPFYAQGHHGVEVFWTISGFVFATVYRATRATTRDFAVNRFARLYPLHLVTLLVVAALQAQALAQLGRWLIYGNNDPAHFIRHLLFVAGEGPNAAFNAPIWSVSVELAIYAVFWLARRRLERWGTPGALALAAGFAVLHKLVGDPITACGVYFFLGCACAALHASIGPARRWAVVAALLAVGVTCFARWSDTGPIKNGVAELAMALVLALSAGERAAPRWLRRAGGAVGDLSYGLYLWHIPVQLCLLLVLGGATAAEATHAWFLALFLTVTALCAIAGYLAIERPARDWLRQRLKLPG